MSDEPLSVILKANLLEHDRRPSLLDDDTIGILSRANVGLEEAYRAAPVGVIVLDRTGRIVVFNPEAVRIFGYSPNQVLGQSVEMLVPDNIQINHVRYREEFLRHPVPRQMGTGRKITGKHMDTTVLNLDIAISYVNTSLGIIPVAYIRLKDHDEDPVVINEDGFVVRNE